MRVRRQFRFPFHYPASPAPGHVSGEKRDDRDDRSVIVIITLAGDAGVSIIVPVNAEIRCRCDRTGPNRRTTAAATPEDFDGVGTRASASGERAETGVVPVRQMASQPSARSHPWIVVAVWPAPRQYDERALKRRCSGQEYFDPRLLGSDGAVDTLVTQAGRPSVECRADDIDHVQTTEQGGSGPVRASPARPASRPAEVPAPAARLDSERPRPSTPSVVDGHHRRLSSSRALTCSC